MKRRDLIVGLSAVALIGSAQAQQNGKVRRIAIVSPVMSVVSNWPIWDELRPYGYVEGKNLLIERYFGEGRAYPDLARDVVHRNPDVIIAFYTELVLALKAATSTIPIVGGFGFQVEAGIVQSLARPGGNITGVSVDAGPEEWSKRIQLLQQVVPRRPESHSSYRNQSETDFIGQYKNFSGWREPPWWDRRSISRPMRQNIAACLPPLRKTVPTGLS